MCVADALAALSPQFHCHCDSSALPGPGAGAQWGLRDSILPVPSVTLLKGVSVGSLRARRSYPYLGFTL